MAAVLAHGQGALLSHASAAALWGLTRSRNPVDVTSPRGGKRDGIRLHRMRVHTEDRAVIDGIPVTSVARTLFDLAEVVGADRHRRIWEEADRLNLLRVPAVQRVCEQNPGRRALRPVLQLIAAAQEPVVVRSPLEERFLDFCRSHGLPPPATNAVIEGKEVDAVWLKERVMVELDGWAFHRPRAAFEGDRVRDAGFQSRGWSIVRLTDRRLKHEPTRVLAELRRLLSLG